MSQNALAASIARHLAESLKNFVEDDSLADDINARVENDPELEESMATGITDVAELKSAVFHDPRVQKVLLDIIDTAVDAATYMRY